jgi:hypothetical protein
MVIPNHPNEEDDSHIRYFLLADETLTISMPKGNEPSDAEVGRNHTLDASSVVASTFPDSKVDSPSRAKTVTASNRNEASG